MRRILIGWAVTILIALSASSEAQTSGSEAFADYVAFGQTATIPELGVASWYGEEFDGSPTASGELYDMNGLTAASPDLPLGTKVSVTNLMNDRSLILRVNDRGPSIAGRLLDVSKAAAWRLGFMKLGLALVSIRVVSYPRSYRKPSAGTIPQELAMNPY